MSVYEEIEKDALWVIRHYGSDAQEEKEPGSKAKAQAKRIAEFVRQQDTAFALLNEHRLDLIRVVGIFGG